MPFDGTEYPETTAKKMLKVFGENGEHWIVLYVDDRDGNHCLLGALFKVEAGDANATNYSASPKLPLLAEIVKRMGARDYHKQNRDIEEWPRDIALDMASTVAQWNNAQKWPQIKLALEYMHEAEIAEMVEAE